MEQANKVKGDSCDDQGVHDIIGTQEDTNKLCMLWDFYHLLCFLSVSYSLFVNLYLMLQLLRNRLCAEWLLKLY